jgi:hypothetical protein
MAVLKKKNRPFEAVLMNSVERELLVVVINPQQISAPIPNHLDVGILPIERALFRVKLDPAYGLFEVTILNADGITIDFCTGWNLAFISFRTQFDGEWSGVLPIPHGVLEIF